MIYILIIDPNDHDLCPPMPATTISMQSPSYLELLPVLVVPEGEPVVAVVHQAHLRHVLQLGQDERRPEVFVSPFPTRFVANSGG